MIRYSLESLEDDDWRSMANRRHDFERLQSQEHGRFMGKNLIALGNQF